VNMASDMRASVKLIRCEIGYELVIYIKCAYSALPGLVNGEDNDWTFRYLCVSTA
jgi:hypothetical protein